jgi:hypothetical protein
MTSREEIIAAGLNRRRRARDGIIDAIAEANDEAMKVVLLLLLQVVEEIGDKIDTILADERSLRQAVLNGHEPVHHKHHEWIAAKIAEEEQAQKDANELALTGKKAAVSTGVQLLLTGAASAIAGAIGAAVMLR